jgi:hypothetical protein
MGVHLLQRAPRNANMGRLHLTFFVTAITTELCIRTQLYLTTTRSSAATGSTSPTCSGAGSSWSWRWRSS